MAVGNEFVWLKPIVNPISVTEDAGSWGSPIRDLRLLIGLCR